MTRYGETEADDLFRSQAEAEGYLAEGRRGLWAWYRDNGLLPPEVARRVVVRPSRDGSRGGREITGLDMDHRSHPDRRSTNQTEAPTAPVDNPHVLVRLPSESPGLTGQTRPQPNRWHK